MPNLGAPEIAIILVLALLLFGGKKLPELGSSVGKTITNFRKGLAEAKEEDEASAAASGTPAASDPAPTGTAAPEPTSTENES